MWTALRIIIFGGNSSASGSGGGGGGGIALQSDFANTATTEAWVFW